MCIICIKPQGTTITALDWDRLKESFNSNPDGGGFMWTDGSDVHIRKGFMNWIDFESAIYTYELHRYKGVIVFHTRIGTHGATTEGETHPFPITADEDRLRATVASTKAGIVHNGILSTVPVPKNSALSDTQIYIRDYLALLDEGSIENEGVQMLMQSSGSKFAILTPSTLYTIGSFITEDNGWRFSNSTYKPAPVVTYGSYNGGIYHGGYPIYDSNRSWWDTPEKDVCDMCSLPSYDVDWDDTSAMMMCTDCFDETYTSGKANSLSDDSVAGELGVSWKNNAYHI